MALYKFDVNECVRLSLISSVFLVTFIFRLAEVGVLEMPKLQGKYDTGQVCPYFALLIIGLRLLSG